MQCKAEFSAVITPCHTIFQDFFLFLYVDLGLKNLIIIIINTENSYDT